MKSDDETFNRRINHYGTVLNKYLDTSLNNPKDGERGGNPETECKLLFDAQKTLQLINSPEYSKLKLFYTGMKSTL